MTTILYGEEDFKGIFDISQKCKFPVCNTNKEVNKFLLMIYRKLLKLKSQNMTITPIDIIKIETIEQITQLFADQGGFAMTQEIQDYIKENALYLLNYAKTIRGRQITVSIILTELSDVSDFAKFNQYILLIYWWLDIAYGLINNSNCSKKLHINLILTDLNKHLPDNIIDVISQKHVNTGYTWACKYDNKIIIYRKEEWFRVFIHESFHALGLDNINSLNMINKNIKDLFPLNINISVGEAYCEFWARIIKSAIFSFVINQDNLSETKYLGMIYKLINIERVFSLFQGIKVLRYMNLTYEDLIETDEQSKIKRMRFYKEDSNVFAYYVLTMILMSNYSSFLKWCIKNNMDTIKLTSSINAQDSLMNYFKGIYKSKQFLDILTCMTSIYDLKLLEKKNKQLMNTTRMTIVDIS